MKNKSILKYVLIALVLIWAGKQIAFKFFPPIPAKEGFPLTQKWMTKFGSNVFDLAVAQDGTLLVRTAYLNAIDTTSGQLRWRVLLDHEVGSDAGMEREGVVYVTTPTSLLAIKLETGEIIWEEGIRGGNLVGAVSNDIILLNMYNEFLSAHDTAFGNQLWGISVGEGRLSALIWGKDVFVARNGVSSLSILTGETTWRLNRKQFKSPTLSDDLVYFSTRREVICIDPNEKVGVWIQELLYYDSRKHTIHNEILILTNPNDIRALDKINGEMLWEREITSPQNPVVIGNVVYVMEGFSRNIFAFDISTGEYLGKLYSSTPQFVFTERNYMVTSEGLLIFARGNRLFAFGE